MAQYLGVDVVNSGKYFFVSYNTEDADIVSQYVKAMEYKGLPIWYDYGIEVGDKWSNTIADKIANSEAVIMFLSRQIFNKEESFVHKEWEMAKDFFDKKIYVIMLDDIDKKEVPLRYISWWIDVNHMQCIVAPNYNSVIDCVDKLALAVGYKGRSDDELISELFRHATDEALSQNEKMKLEDDLISKSDDAVFQDETVSDSFDFGEETPDLNIQSGVLKRYKGDASVIIIPDDVVKISFNAFNGCKNITKIIMPDSVRFIDSFAFSECKSLETIRLSENLVSLDQYAFLGCSSLKSIKLPNKLRSIENSAFKECSSLKEVIIPHGVTKIGEDAFRRCESLEKLVIPDSVTSIGKAFCYGCKKLREIRIPEGIKSIENYAFYNCSSLENVSLPNSVTSIGNNAFYSCKSLPSINIPGCVIRIGKNSFSDCDVLLDVFFGGTEADWKKIGLRQSWYESKPRYIVHFNK